VLERNLKTDASTLALQEEGGIYALVGATGVGKTTTTAKLAGLCARLHGPTAGPDHARQLPDRCPRTVADLRTHAGVVAHLAHDRAALQDLLNLLGNKKMILIDTTGLAPRDPRKREMLDVLDLPQVNRLLVLNASATATPRTMLSPHSVPTEYSRPSSPKPTRPSKLVPHWMPRSVINSFCGV